MRAGFAQHEHEQEEQRAVEDAGDGAGARATLEEAEIVAPLTRVVRDEDERQRPGDGAPQSGHAADHEGDDEEDGEVEAELGVGRLRRLDHEQRTGHAGDGGAQAEGEGLDDRQVHARRGGAGLVVALGDDGPADAALDQVPDEDEAHRADDEDDEVVPRQRAEP